MTYLQFYSCCDTPEEFKALVKKDIDRAKFLSSQDNLELIKESIKRVIKARPEFE